MTAFSKENDRETRIFGTKGEIVGDFDENVIYVKPFLGATQSYSAEKIESGHGGADTVTVADFLASARGEKEMCTPIDVSVESHAMCAAAEGRWEEPLESAEKDADHSAAAVYGKYLRALDLLDAGFEPEAVRHNLDPEITEV